MKREISLYLVNSTSSKDVPPSLPGILLEKFLG